MNKTQKSEEKSDSIRLVRHRFRTSEVGESEKICNNLYPIRWNYVNHKGRCRHVVLSCQTTNYQFFVKYNRYFLDTCTLSYLAIGCQFESEVSSDLRIKMAASRFWRRYFGLGDNSLISVLLGGCFLRPQFFNR